MAKSTVLILHGIKGRAGIHWQKWLNDELSKSGYNVIIPNLPNSDHPDRSQWLSEIKRQTRSVDLQNLIIVGHSLGVISALDFIENLESPIKALISVGGFSEDYGAELNSYFVKERVIDFNKVHKNLKKAVVIFGDNDPRVPRAALISLTHELGVEPVIIKGGGHLNTEAGFTTFPQLLEIIKNL